MYKVGITASVDSPLYRYIVIVGYVGRYVWECADIVLGRLKDLDVLDRYYQPLGFLGVIRYRYVVFSLFT